MPPQGSERQRKGERGEAEATRFLENKGHCVLERNYRSGRGEIDIITRDGDTLVFVEVKSGSSTAFGDPEDRVTDRKRRQIGKVAAAYLSEREPGEIDCRFDVVSVVRSGGRTEIRHFENAFWLDP